MVLAVVIAFCSLVACKREHATRLIVAVIPQSLLQEVFLNERAGIDEAAAALGLDAQWKRPGDSDPQRQIDLIEAAVKARSYGIIVNPAYGAATNTVVQDALTQGIPVVIARDSIPMDPQEHLSFVLSDEQVGAELVARRLCGKIGRPGYVAIVGLDSYAADSLRRLDATENALHRICPALHIGHPVTSPYSTSYAQIAVRHLRQEHPDMVALIALNPRAGLGAALEIERGQASRQKIIVIVYDQSIPLLLRLRRGVVDSIVGQNMRQIGATAMENLVHDRHGESYPHLVKLAPMLITRDNIDEGATQDWLLFGWEQP